MSCEDQGFTLISEGCFHCLPTFKDGKPVRTPLIKVERYGKRYWQCPKCLGYYGPAPLAPVSPKNLEPRGSVADGGGKL